MNVYTWNKIISLALPLLAILSLGFIAQTPQNWTALLVGVSLLGYTHYVLGAYYQHKAWQKRVLYSRFVFWFILLSVLSVGFTIFAVALESLWLVALLTIPYFVWHGYENEQTLYRRSTGLELSPLLIGGISIVAVGATIDAFRHTSAGFTASLSYHTAVLMPPTKAVVLSLAPYLFWVGLAGMVIGAGLLGYYWYRARTAAAVWWFLVAFGLLAWFWYANPLPYVWFFVLLLGYHFVTWGLHYGLVFWPDSRRFFSYIGGHILVVGGILLTSIVLVQITDRFPLGLLNSELFLAATLVHISTSFLNDDQVRMWLRL